MTTEEFMIRLYNSEKDSFLIVQTLYTDFKSEEGIAQIKREDHIFSNNPDDNIRLVAVDNQGKIISSMVILRDHNVSSHFGLYSLVTYPKYRGSGVTSEILLYGLKWIKSHNGKVVKTSTDENNIAAKKFLSKHRFHITHKENGEIFYQYLT